MMRPQKPGESTRILLCRNCGAMGHVVQVNRYGRRYWHVFFNSGCKICETPINSSHHDDHFERKSDDILELNRDKEFIARYKIKQ